MLYSVEPTNIVDDRALYPYAGAAPLTQNIAADADHKLPTVPRRHAQSNTAVDWSKNAFSVYIQRLSFYRAMLCIRGTSHGPVSVRPCPSVCHKSEFY